MTPKTVLFQPHLGSISYGPASAPSPRALARLLPASVTLFMLALAGCSTTFVTPDSLTGEASAATSSPAISGSVYGGHAPIVGAKVYVLTPSTTANAGASTSLMNSTSSTTGGYPVAKDTSGGVSNNMYYVTSDANGNFNLTGDYACSVNQPVYIAAVGGSPVSIGTSANTFNIASVTVSNLAGTSTNTGTATYTFNISGSNPELFYIGEQVTFHGVSMTTNGGDPTFLSDYGPYTVSATGLGTTSFQITFNGDYGGYPGAGNAYFAAGNYTQTGATVTASAPNNPGVVNMAALGICPSSGTFAGHVSYIYMNEISTAALAYATAAFGTDAFHIGVNQTGTLNTSTDKGYVTGSMVQAFNNAGLLYDITGTNLSTTFAGEGHIARLTTPAGNGTVPQSKLDTLGNILAACVDSANTSASASPQCTSLFATATSDGSSTGSKPADIAAAAFNIANFPSGTANSSFVTTLFNLPSGNVPFAPYLSTAPSDWTLGIQFKVNSSNGGTDNLISNPQIIALDGQPNVGTESGLSGNANAIWIGSYGAQPAKLLTSGTPDYAANAAGLASSTRARSVAVDSGGNLWIMNEATTVLQQFSDAGTLLISVSSPTNPFTGNLFFNGTDAAIDASGNVYANYENVIYKRTSAGVNVPYTGGGATAAWSSNNSTLGTLGTYTHNGYFDSTGLFYIVNNGGTLCVANPATDACTYTATGFSAGSASNAIYFGAMDASNTLWTVPSSNATTTIVGYNYSKKSTAAYYTLTGGGLNTPTATAVDGAGNIWVANAGNASLSAFTPAGTALSTTAGFGALNFASTNSADLAIDRAGDVWVVYSGSNVVVEMIGLATPAVSPTAFATFNGWIGKRPL